jgi:parallel beta-helix repeat protein
MGDRRTGLVLGLFVILLGAITVLIPTQTVYAGLPPSIFTILDDSDGGDCETEDIGIWNDITKTCLLLADLPLGSNIEIDDDGITLNCAGHLLEGSGFGSGISLQDQNLVTIKNCHVKGFGAGIVLGGSHGSTFTGNTANENINEGFFAFGSSGNTFKDNTASGNGIGMNFILGNTNNILKGNTANDNVFDGILIFPFNPGHTLIGNTANGNNVGITIDNSNDSILIGNTANENNSVGILIIGSNDNTLKGNTANGNTGIGIDVFFSDSNTLKDNWNCSRTFQQ